MLSISLACAYLGWRYRKNSANIISLLGNEGFFFFFFFLVCVGGWGGGMVYVECLVFLLHETSCCGIFRKLHTV